jgi:predicted GNAT family acetyltransferase
MRVHTYASAAAFLQRTGPVLEANEVANSLMLGICGQLLRRPELFQTGACLKSVEAEGELVLAAPMTPPHKLVVSAHEGDLDLAARLLIEDLLAGGWQIPGILGPAPAAAVAEAWAARTGQPSRLVGRQRLYALRQVPAPVPVPGRLRPATHTDVDRVGRWRHAFHVEIFGHAAQAESTHVARLRVKAGDIYLWEDGQPVSMAMQTRPTRHGISISLVYTPPAKRRKGYATACVGALSRNLLGSDWAFCTLFAALDNPASNRVYQRLGYRPVADVDEFEFPTEGSARLGGDNPSRREIGTDIVRPRDGP